MEWINIPIKEWFPDQPDFQNPGVITATNVIPGATSYEPLSSSVTYSSALHSGTDDYVRGAHAVPSARYSDATADIADVTWAKIATASSEKTPRHCIHAPAPPKAMPDIAD